MHTTEDASGFIDYQDGKTRQIHVSLHTPAGVIRCGRIEFNSTLQTGRFIYEDGYTGPALDPIHLPCPGSAQQHTAGHEIDAACTPELMHRVFLDYMPGPWGQNILEAEFPYLNQYRQVERLHWLGTRTVGCLSFHVDERDSEQPIGGAQRLQEIRHRSVGVAMGRLPRVGDLECDAGEGPTPRWLLEGLAAFGGARPKCIYRDWRGKQWLAKFNLEGAPYNCARVEHATAMLAKLAGIDVALTRCMRAPGANDILFVKRFDREDGRDGSTRHKVSVFSLLSHQEAPHHSGGDYRLIFDRVERLCTRPDHDRRELIRRMLFNVAVNNTDDHLKNFELLYDFRSGGYELSPAFDITVDPYPNPRCTKVFGMDSPSLAEETVYTISESLHEPLGSVMEIREEVLRAMRQWRALFKLAGVSERDCKKLSRALDRCLEVNA